MAWSLRAARRLALALVVIGAAFAAGPALAEIFKCSAKDGSPLYQNFPCHIDSLGSMPSQPMVSKPASQPAAALKQDKPKAAQQTARVADTLVKPTAATTPQPGMTEDQVTAILGQPDEMLEDEERNGRFYIWRYGDRQNVIFDTRRHVVSVQRNPSQQ